MGGRKQKHSFRKRLVAPAAALGAGAASHFAFFHGRIRKASALMGVSAHHWRESKKTIAGWDEDAASCKKKVSLCKAVLKVQKNEDLLDGAVKDRKLRDDLAETAKECGPAIRKCEKDGAILALSDALSNIFKEHNVPLFLECFDSKKDSDGRKTIAPKCLPKDKNKAEEFRKKVSAWNAEARKQPKEIDHIGTSLFIVVTSANSFAAEYARTKSHRGYLLRNDVLASLTAAAICFVILKYAPRAVARRKAEKERRKKSEAVQERIDKMRTEAERDRERAKTLSREMWISHPPQTKPLETKKTTKPRKRRLSKEDLIEKLDQELEERFGIYGLAAALEHTISKRDAHQFLREPRGLYYLVREQRRMLESMGFDTHEIRRALREGQEEITEEISLTDACQSQVIEPDYESVLGKCVFTDGMKERLDGLTEVQRKALLRRLWEYSNGLRPPRTYPELGPFLGLNFSSEGRVLFIKCKEEEKIRIVFLSTVHQEYMKFLRTSRKNKDKIPFMAKHEIRDPGESG